MAPRSCRLRGQCDQWAHKPRAALADAAAKLPVGGFTTFPIAEAEAYFDAVAAEGIVVDRSERRQLVAEAVVASAATVGCETTDEPALLDEVTELIEAHRRHCWVPLRRMSWNCRRPC